jgi:chemotaxis protein MotA
LDLATLIGFVVAVGIIIAAMVMGGGLTAFVNVPSMMVVFGGTIGAVMMNFTIGQFLGAIKVALKALIYKIETPTGLIDQLVEMAKEARTGGLLVLEGKETDNEFLSKGIQMLVDGYESPVISQNLRADMNQAAARHTDGADIFTKVGEVAPAMGMIGTLVGLILMLGNLSDPASIGPSMAVALLTTLYGALLANVFAIPLAGKLTLRRNEEVMMKSIIIDAVAAIQEGKNPRVLEELLKTYLPGSQRETEDESGENKPASPKGN